MRRTLLTLAITVAVLTVGLAGSTSAQASPALSTGDAVESISVQPMDDDDLQPGPGGGAGGGGGGGGGGAITPSPCDFWDIVDGIC